MKTLIIHEGENVDTLKEQLWEEISHDEKADKNDYITTLDKEVMRQYLSVVPKNRFSTIIFTSSYHASEMLGLLREFGIVCMEIVFLGKNTEDVSVKNVFFREQLRIS